MQHAATYGNRLQTMATCGSTYALGANYGKVKGIRGPSVKARRYVIIYHILCRFRSRLYYFMIYIMLYYSMSCYFSIEVLHSLYHARLHHMILALLFVPTPSGSRVRPCGQGTNPGKGRISARTVTAYRGASGGGSP